MPVFPVVVSPESLFSTFFWLTSLSQKPATQPLLLCNWFWRTLISVAHMVICSSWVTCPTIWVPSASISHFITEGETMWVKCFLLYCWSICFWASFLVQIGLKLTDILLSQIPKCWDYGHNPPCPFFTFHFLHKNSHTWRFLSIEGFLFPLNYNSKNSDNERCIFTIHYIMYVLVKFIHNYSAPILSM